MSRSAVIVDVVRTPLGARNGTLREWHPVDLAALTLRALATRSDLDPALVDDVIMGCVTQVGEQACNVGRNAVLGAGWPESVPSTTVDRQCGSSQQALHFAAQGVIAGAYDVVVAAGVEVMSRVPIGAAVANGMKQSPYAPSIIERYIAVGGLQPQGISAERIADRWGITREAADAFSIESHRRAARATADGRFANEIVPVPRTTGARSVAPRGGRATVKPMTADEAIRDDLSREAFAALKPAYAPDGTITAANSAQIADGAAAALIMSDEMAQRLGLRPWARFHAFALAGVDPVTGLTGPIPATRRVLERAGLTIDRMDAIEIHEAFAAVVLAWAEELHPDMARVNPNGGAIALGHPLGCSGARQLATLLNELERSGGRFGLLTMSEAGGLANATIIERL